MGVLKLHIYQDVVECCSIIEEIFVLFLVRFLVSVHRGHACSRYHSISRTS